MLEILNDHDFENFRKLIYDESGITFSETNRSILDSRIKELLRLKQIATPAEYYAIVLRNPEGQVSYTRLGEFTFDKEGVYRAKNGNTVQGYILNDKGEVMAGTKSLSADLFEETALKGGAMSIPTTNIKLWIDPNNGKFLGKYDEYEIKNDGTIYGKADGGNRSVPLYKIATANFHNPNGLYEVKDGLFVETADSGKPVVGCGEIRSGLLEQSNIDFKNNMADYQMAKVQMELVNALIKTNKDLLQSAMELATQS